MATHEKLKIAVVHDHLSWRGGGERTALLIALELEADFITVYTNPEAFSEYQNLLGSRLITLSDHILDKEVIRFFWMRWQFFKHRAIFKKYDMVIASSQAATEAVAKYSKRRASTILYCHTPPRRVYDLYGFSRDRYKLFLRPLFFLFTRYWDYAYRKALRRYDHIIANSQTIKDRLLNFTGHLANRIIWPPITTDRFHWIEQDDYYLSWARTDEQKRVELIVEAFIKMPDKKLIVASGGSRFEQVKKLAYGHKNISVVGWVSDEELTKLVGRCRAVIYIPNNEDAGMTNLEANAAGKPVIGVNEGGLRETIIDDKNGIKIKPQPTADDLIAAVNFATPEWCLEKRQFCEKHAQQFDLKIFAKKIKQVVDDNNPNIPLMAIDVSHNQDLRHTDKLVRTGVETYSNNTVQALISEAKKHNLRLRLYAPRPIDGLPTELQKVIPGRKLWTLRKLSQELKKNTPDYFFTPGYFLPSGSPKKSYATVHDVKFKSNPSLYTLSDRLWQTFTFAQNYKRAKKIFTVSKESEQEMINLCHVAKERIVCLPICYERWIYGEKSDLKRMPVIFFVGRIDKKKSIDVLIRAFGIFSSTHPGWRLVLAGKPGFGADELKKLVQDLGLDTKIEF
ncbi:glycosyltransferase, partial [Candidatus Falkowbacteria bacterium]|nr:glycosyltransferase [Candidatus Falkowbacteria bacterium]